MTRFYSADSNRRSSDVSYPDGWEDLLVSYALGDLSPQEEKSFEQLLKNYPELAPEVKAFQTSWESLPLDLPEQFMPESLEPCILAAADSAPQQQSIPQQQSVSQQQSVPQQSKLPTIGASPLSYPILTQFSSPDSSLQGLNSSASFPSVVSAPLSYPQVASGELTAKIPSYTSPQTQVRRVRPSRSRAQSLARRKWQPWGGAITAALLATVLGLNNFQLRSQLGRTTNENLGLQSRLDARTAEMTTLENANLRDQAILTTLRQPNTLVYDLEGIGDAVNAFGSLLAAPDHSEVTLVVENLPPLSESQIYRLWAAATLTAQPIFCGEFSEAVEGTAVWTVPDALCSNAPAKIIITVDAVVDPLVPKGPAVLQSTLQ
ncbi:MAG: anti-sigma factor [Cyanobacteria bacterium J06555_13]